MQDIEMNSLESNSATQLLDQPPPEDTRLKTRALTYIRQNYLQIILSLLTFICILLFVVVILVVTYVHYATSMPMIISEHLDEMHPTIRPSNIVPMPTARTEDRQPIARDDDSALTTTPQSIYELTSSRVDRPENKSDAPTSRKSSVTEHVQSRVEKSKPCRRVKCDGQPCLPTSVSYEELRRYTCCECIDPKYLFRQYRYDLIADAVSLKFQVPNDISGLSVDDLELMDKLPGLDGFWNLEREGDATYYLLYEDIAIPTPSPED